MKKVVVFLLPVFAAFGQARGPLGEYALILEDAPVAQKVQSRIALQGGEARAQMARVRNAQAGVMAELARRKVEVTGAGQVLVNAVFVAATRETAIQLRNVPGVAHVVRVPRLKPDLDRAIGLENVPAAWSAVGGVSQAGAGIKIGIIDSGIDQNHPGFQDPSLTPPAGFPKGDTNYTNSKVIVARSYVDLDSVGYDPNDPVATSHPDDYSPRDRIGHGTAIAMIAAGVQNTGPAGTIQGVAPKAFLGNYKIFGSPSINQFARFAAFEKALEDALADGMDVVTLSMSEGDPVWFAPLDSDPQCGGQCDVYSQAVENAVNAGMVVVASAGNDGNVGQRYPTLNTVHRPGASPSAITVGAVANSHNFYQSVRVNGQSIKALFGDGPHIASPLTAPIRDVAATGNDGLACTSLPAGSLSGTIALVQRGTCSFSDKINNAQNAGALGVIIYQTDGQENIFSNLGAPNTGIPAVMVGNSDGRTIKAQSGNVTLDPAMTAYETTAGTMWPQSSRGPSPGTFGSTPTTTMKPELVAVGAGIYTAAQKFDPNGDAYNSSGYTSVSGTSYAVPMVAGAVALVKQKNPSFTPAQLKSAVVNTAAQGVTEQDGSPASINSTGAGQLDASAAVNTVATLEPATIEFGQIESTTVSISRNLRITNVSSSPATFNLTVGGTPDSIAQLTVSPTSVTVPAGNFSDVTVRLAGNRPNPGSYQSFITVTGAGQTLRVPYQYLVGTGAGTGGPGTPADVFPIGNGGFVGGVNDQGWELDLRVIDQYGVPVDGVPLTFGVVSGGGKVTSGDQRSFRLGNAAASVNLGPNQGDQIFNAVIQSAGSPTVQFFGYARNYPAIDHVAAAAGTAANGSAPGSYVGIYGTALSDATQVESTTSLPVALSDVSVSFDGAGMSLPGHLHFVSPGQVNVQIPWEFQGQTSVYMKVTASLLPSAVYLMKLTDYSPGIFATVDYTSGTVVTTTSGVKRGDTLIIYANGLGPVNNRPASGEASPDTPATTTTIPKVTIGGVDVPVAFSGLTPGSVGLYQINVTVPSNTPVGTQPMVVSIGGVSSSPVNVPVQ
jgi:minor extracellular serine protease Vpr